MTIYFTKSANIRPIITSNGPKANSGEDTCTNLKENIMNDIDNSSLPSSSQDVCRGGTIRPRT
ncbi:hypothetical protein DPMN_061031 [Dreissena polymorpha]|uniref:Uncharacterized protein n=1 Tax=Dreissena polymorpha TaxID=45954 RepID=A0A9D4C700_DREPO|nr:hypothetical protein DPMN_061031 [Dreissena polymorpha]